MEGVAGDEVVGDAVALAVEASVVISETVVGLGTAAAVAVVVSVAVGVDAVVAGIAVGLGLFLLLLPNLVRCGVLT